MLLSYGGAWSVGALPDGVSIERRVSIILLSIFIPYLAIISAVIILTGICVYVQKTGCFL
jgi:hypothetical protein